MIRMGFRALRMVVVLSTAAAFPSTSLCFAQSLNDQKAWRAMNQKPSDWGQALPLFLAAHAQDRTNIERYYFIANCLQNTNHPLPAMAWYQTYLAAPGSDPQKAKLVRNQIGLLEIDVRSKMGFLFTEAIGVGEKLVKGKVARTGVEVKYTRYLFSMPLLQGESGLVAEALATQKRIDALGVLPEYGTIQFDPRYGGLGASPTPEGRYLFSAALAGDAAAVKSELLRLPVDAKDENGFALLGSLSELVRFNLNQEMNYRLALAEQITRDDPMENLDARADRILVQKDREEIPPALGELAREIGKSYLKVRAMRPENSKPELSSATRKLAIERMRGICNDLSIGSGSRGTEYDRVIVKAVSRIDINQAHIEIGGTPWPYIAWALKKWGEGMTDGSGITLLNANSMGINDPVTTTDKNSMGNRPLHWAVQWNNLAAVEVLLKHKADPRIKNSRGLTPLDMAQDPYRSVWIPLEENPPGKAHNETIQIIQRLKQAMNMGQAR